MFTRILIANRGEIACRIIASARRLGVQTVAVHSDVDAGALHVSMADEAVPIGGATPAESYLRSDRIIAAALATGAEAIHPGYGFLSENPDFVAQVQAARLVFIGPDPDAIRAMGLKDAAKSLMQQAGVPVVPGYHGTDRDPALLARHAEAIGYPVLIKARAGGGGKGMRLVEAPEAFPSALASAEREAQAAFGDPVCLIEKYIAQPRHIEMQIFGDAHGSVIHLFERDCSLQRRHQKVIEEAPAPGMTPEMRAAMGKAAVEAARAIGYRGAGTVEFIVDGSGPLRPDGFWFMEMNTRLQVEHPVSEAITGLDFVELQLRIAAGEPLPCRQEDLSLTGWAFEARLYAEDADNAFLPATGRLDRLQFPEATTFAQGPLRIDSGVRQGDQISPFYDPMIAKIITHGPTRDIALRCLSTALQDSRVEGSVTNLSFLAALSEHPGFQRGDVDTGLIARDLTQLLHRNPPEPHLAALAGLAALGLLERPESPDPWAVLTGWRHWPGEVLSVTLEHEAGPLTLGILPEGGQRFRIEQDGESLHLSVLSHENGKLRIALPDRSVTVDLHRVGQRITLHQGRQSASFTLPDPSAQPEAEAGGDRILAPMPGLVTRLDAQPGQTVAKGQVLILLEAMKMEHSLTAPRDGTVAEVLVASGDQVTNGMALLVLEPADG